MANRIEIEISAKDNATKTFKVVADAGRSMFSDIGAVAGGIQLSGLISRVETLGTSLIKTGIGFDAFKEQANIAFTTMLRSGEKARIFLEDLQNFANKTPFRLEGVTQLSQKLLAMGFAAGEVIPTLTSLGNAVAGLGGNEEVLNRVIIAIGQMRAKGVVSAEEMRQLTEAGIDAWQSLADKIGVSVPEAMKKVEQRMVSSGTGIQAVLEGINRKFDGMMDKQSKTFNGMLSNLKDMAEQAAGRVFEPLFLRAKEGMEDLLGVTASSDWETNLDRIELGVFGIVKAIDNAIERAGVLLGRIKSMGGLYNLGIGGVTLGDVGKGLLNATGIPAGLDYLTSNDKAKSGAFTPPSERQLRENEIRERIRQRSGNLSEEERMILEAQSMRDAAVRRQMASEKGAALPDFAPLADQTKKLVNVFMEAGDTLRGALGKVDDAIGGLFGKPTIEGLSRTLQADKLQLRLDELAEKFRPSINRLNDFKDSLSAIKGRLDDWGESISARRDALSDAGSGMDERISALQKANDRANEFTGTGMKNPYGTETTGELGRAIRDKKAIEAQQKALDREEKARQQQLRVVEKQEKAADLQIKAMEQQQESVRRRLDAINGEMKLDADRKQILKDQLELLDRTRLSEADFNKKVKELEGVVPSYTQKIKDSAQALGVDLVSGMDALKVAANGPQGAAPALNAVTSAAYAFVNFVKRNMDPNADRLGPGGTVDNQGKQSALPAPDNRFVWDVN